MCNIILFLNKCKIYELLSSLHGYIYSSTFQLCLLSVDARNLGMPVTYPLCAQKSLNLASVGFNRSHLSVSGISFMSPTHSALFYLAETNHHHQEIG